MGLEVTLLGVLAAAGAGYTAYQQNQAMQDQMEAQAAALREEQKNMAQNAAMKAAESNIAASNAGMREQNLRFQQYIQQGQFTNALTSSAAYGGTIVSEQQNNVANQAVDINMLRADAAVEKWGYAAQEKAYFNASESYGARAAQFESEADSINPWKAALIGFGGSLLMSGMSGYFSKGASASAGANSSGNILIRQEDQRWIKSTGQGIGR